MVHQNRSIRRNSGKRLRSRVRGRSQQRRLNQQGAGKLYCPLNYKYCNTWTVSASDIPLEKRCVKSKVLDPKSAECGVKGDKRMGALNCVEMKANIALAEYGEECKF